MPDEGSPLEQQERMSVLASTDDFDKEYPRIEGGADEAQHGAGEDPVQPTT